MRTAVYGASFEQDEQDVVGETISHYRVLRELGRGGMGLVYEAEDLTLGRRVALKFLTPGIADSAQVMDRFRLEACAASALNYERGFAGRWPSLTSYRLA